MSSRFKCSMDDYFMLHRLRDDLIRLRVEHRNAEERQQYYIKAGNFESAQLASNTADNLLKEIKLTEKEIEKLENACL